MNLGLILILGSLTGEALTLSEGIDSFEQGIGIICREELGIFVNHSEVVIQGPGHLLYLIFVLLVLLALASVGSSVASTHSHSRARLLVGFLLLTLGFCLIVQLLLSDREFILYFIQVGCVGIYIPSMSLDVLNRRSLSGVKGQHGSNHCFELLAKEVCWLVFGVRFPEQVSSISTEQSVEGV